MNGIILPIYTCVQLKIFYKFCNERNIKLDKALALHNEKTSTINEVNLNIKNLSAELGIFLLKNK